MRISMTRVCAYVRMRMTHTSVCRRQIFNFLHTFTKV